MILCWFIVDVSNTLFCYSMLPTDSTFSLNQSTGALVLNEMVKVLKIRTYEIEIMVVNIRMGRGSLCTSTRKKWSGNQCCIKV